MNIFNLDIAKLFLMVMVQISMLKKNYSPSQIPFSIVETRVLSLNNKSWYCVDNLKLAKLKQIRFVAGQN